MGFTRDSYFRESFTSLSLSDEVIKSREFEECGFTGCSFIDCRFEKCRFISCRFHDCTVSAVSPVNSYITDVAFSKCRVMGCDWTRAAQLHGIEFTDCRVSYSNFSMMKLPRIRMAGCEAREVDFSGADLSGGDFTGTDFERSTFNRTNLSGANLKGAVNYSIDPRCNTLKHARFSLPGALSLLSCLDIEID